MKFNRFVGGHKGTVYVCKGCGKRTRETGAGESSCELCAACYEDAGNENLHNDTHRQGEPVAGCRFCEEAS